MKNLSTAGKPARLAILLLIQVMVLSLFPVPLHSMEKESFEIVIESGSGGRLHVSSKEMQVSADAKTSPVLTLQEETELTVEAVPDPGFRLKDLFLNGARQPADSEKFLFTVGGDSILKAEFEKIPETGDLEENSGSPESGSNESAEPDDPAGRDPDEKNLKEQEANKEDGLKESDLPDEESSAAKTDEAADADPVRILESSVPLAFSSEAQSLYEANKNPAAYSVNPTGLSSSLSWLTPGSDEDGLLVLDGVSEFSLDAQAKISWDGRRQLDPGTMQIRMPLSFFVSNEAAGSISYSINASGFSLAKDESSQESILINTSPIEAKSQLWNLDMQQRNISLSSAGAKNGYAQTRQITLESSAAEDKKAVTTLSNTIQAQINPSSEGSVYTQWKGASIEKNGNEITLKGTPGVGQIAYIPGFTVYLPDKDLYSTAYCCMPEIAAAYGEAIAFNLPEWTAQKLPGNIYVMDINCAKYLVGGYYYFLNCAEFGDWPAELTELKAGTTLFDGLVQCWVWRCMGKYFPYTGPNGIYTGRFARATLVGSNLSENLQNQFFDAAEKWCQDNWDDSKQPIMLDKNGPVPYSLYSAAFGLRFVIAANHTLSTGQAAVAFPAMVKTEKGKFRIHKSSSASFSEGNPNYDFSGAVYEVLSASGVKLTELTIGKDGYSDWSPELEAGTYEIREVSFGVNGYIPKTDDSGQPLKTTVTVRMQDTLNIEQENLPVGGLNLTLASKKSDLGKPLQGAVFQVEFFLENTSQKPERTWFLKSDSNGEIHYGDPLTEWNGKKPDPYYFRSDAGDEKPVLPLGWVRITEVEAPDGYFLPNHPVIERQVVSTAPKSVSSQKPDPSQVSFQTAAFTDSPITLTVLKVQDDGQNIPLPKAAFEWKDPAGKTTELITDINGELQLSGLVSGTHTLREVRSSDGYQLLPDPISFQVTAAGVDWNSFPSGLPLVIQKTENRILVSDSPNPWKLQITKSNGNGQKLSDAEFTLYEDEQLKKPLQARLTDPNGIAEFAPLDNRKTYWLKETRAPEGYSPSARIWKLEARLVPVQKDWSILVNGQKSTDVKIEGQTAVLSLQIVNPAGSQLPESGSSARILLSAVSLTGLLIGLYLLLPERRKRPD